MKTCFIFILSIVCFSCHRYSKYPGFSELGNGTWYKLHTIGENSVKPRPGDFITVNLSYATHE